MPSCLNERVGDVRILSLDGGGSWAILQAMALRKLYGGDTPGHDVLANFDLAVANSGGSLVLAGLILNWTPTQIFELFKDEEVRRDIFVKNWGMRPHGNRYKAEEKRIGLTAHFHGKGAFSSFHGTAQLETIVGEMHKAQSKGRLTEVVITGYDYDEDRSIFFKSAQGRTSIPNDRQVSRRSNLKLRINSVSLVDACHVATNAPVVYFDDPATVTVDNYPLRGWDEVDPKNWTGA